MAEQPATTTPPTSAEIFYRRHGKGGADVDDKFDIEVPQSSKVVLIIIFAIFVVGQYYYIGDIFSVLIFLALTLVPLILWATLGPNLAEKSILAYLKKTVQKKPATPIDFFVGYPFATKDDYFIEANPVDFDIGKIGQFISRLKDVIFLSIGITILISKTLTPFFFDDMQAYWSMLGTDHYEPYANQEEMVIDVAIYMGPFALLILFAIMPLFFISEDMQIYRIEKISQDPFKVGSYVKTGLLSKVLGFFGIILAFDTAKAFNVGLGFDGINLYIQTFISFAGILIACAASPFIVTLIYLLKYHEIWVNNVRIKASEFLPCATMQVNKVPASELEFLTHPEKVRVTNDSGLVKFFTTTKGYIILIALLIVAFLVSFFMGFIFTGVWSDPILQVDWAI